MAIHNGVTRRFAFRAGLVALSLALAACGSSDPAAEGESDPPAGDSSGPITITYAGAAYAADQIQPVLDAFMDAHPDITVEYESVPFEDFNSVLAARLSNASDAIDVFDVDMPRTDAYMARGWLADLTQTFPDLAESVDPGSLEAATVGDQLVTMPYQTSTNIMYYNASLLEAAGVPLPSADPAERLTWEEVTEQARAAQEAGAQYGIVFDQIDRYYQLEPLAISTGGGPGATGESNLEPDVTNEGWIKAFDWYGSLFADGLSPRGVAVAETPEMFAAGQTAFYVGGPWWGSMFVDNADLQFGVAPFPAFEGGEPATPTGGWSLGMNPKADEETAAAVATFMKFMGVDDGGYAQYLTALAVPPSNLEGSGKFYDSEVFTDSRFAGVVDLMKDELANTATLRLQTVGYVEFEDVMTKAFSDIINGTDAADALKTAEADLVEAWAKFQ